MKIRNLVIGLSAVAAGGISTLPGKLLASEIGEDRGGKQRFIDVGCASCHGTVGQGTIAGTKLAPGPVPLEYFRRYLRAPTGVMPPYAETVLSDEEVTRMHEYLTGIQGQQKLPEVLKAKPPTL